MFTKENLLKFFKSLIWLMILIFVIDIASKWAVVNHFGKEGTVASKSDMIQLIPGFLYIGKTYNQGAAWSLGASSGGRIAFICVSVVLSAILIFYYIKSSKKMKMLVKISIALMIAGAVGNLIDRAFYWEKTVGFSGVVDWISVYFGDKAFPMFNIADSSLVVGVVILLIAVIIDSIKDAIEKGKSGEYKYSPEELKKQKENEENNSK